MARERLQHPKLRRREVNRPPGQGDLMAAQVDDHLAEPEDFRRLVAAAPQDGPDTGHHLARAERLSDVVVGAELKAQEFVRLLVARRQHDDRRAGPLANPPADLAAVELRQHEIQDHQVRAHALVLPERRLPVRGQRDAEAIALEIGAQQLDDLRFVVYNEHRRHDCQSLHGGAVHDSAANLLRYSSSLISPRANRSRTTWTAASGRPQSDRSVITFHAMTRSAIRNTKRRSAPMANSPAAMPARAPNPRRPRPKGTPPGPNPGPNRGP